MNDENRCIKCGQLKSDKVCKPCRTAYDKAYKAAHPEEVAKSRAKYDKNRTLAHTDLIKRRYIEMREQRRLAASKYEKSGLGLELKRARRQKYEMQNKHKTLVRHQTRNAVARGYLLRSPCEICNAIRVEAHHEDYSKPLEVRWLCTTHHNMVHGRSVFGSICLLPKQPDRF